MSILILNGSIGEHSCTRTLLRYIEEQLHEKGTETIFWDLAKTPLPIAAPEYYTRQHEHPQAVVREFATAVEQADGFLLGSPLYHDSFSGVLKNALDTLPHEAFLHKPVGLVSHSSNIRSCVIPCNQLRPVIRSLGGYSALTQIGTTNADYKDTREGLTVGNERIKTRVDVLADELMKLVILFRSGKMH